jgi:hypothetical protein
MICQREHVYEHSASVVLIKDLVDHARLFFLENQYILSLLCTPAEYCTRLEDNPSI